MATPEKPADSLDTPKDGSASAEGGPAKDVEIPSESPAKRGAEGQAAGTDKADGSDPPAKRARVEEPPRSTRPDPSVIRKQVEYYLSDENLRYDKFFHEKISGDPEHWLDMGLILGCKKMKDMRATAEEICAALKGSPVEVRESPCAVRRPQNKELPPLESRPQTFKKKVHAHDGGVVLKFGKIPEEQSWMQVKEKLREKLPEKVQIWYASHVSEKQECVVTCSPFEGDIPFFEELKLEVGGATLACEVCFGEVLQACLKMMPKNIREKREKEARKRAKDRNRPIVVGSQRFMNFGALRGRVKEILNSRSDGEQLKPEGADFKLMKALLGFHPKGEEKGKGCVGMKVDKSPQNENRCFYMIKEDGSTEDFSAKKCLETIEANPPYAEEVQPKATAEAQGKTEAPAKPADDAKPAESSAPVAEEKPTESKPVDGAKPV